MNESSYQMDAKSVKRSLVNTMCDLAPEIVLKTGATDLRQHNTYKIIVP